MSTFSVEVKSSTKENHMMSYNDLCRNQVYKYVDNDGFNVYFIIPLFEWGVHEDYSLPALIIYDESNDYSFGDVFCFTASYDVMSDKVFSHVENGWQVTLNLKINIEE